MHQSRLPHPSSLAPSGRFPRIHGAGEEHGTEAQWQQPPNLDLATPRMNLDRSAIERAERIGGAAARLAMDFATRIREAKESGLSEVVLAEMPPRPFNDEQKEFAAALESAQHKIMGSCRLEWRAKATPLGTDTAAGSQELIALW